MAAHVSFNDIRIQTRRSVFLSDISAVKHGRVKN
jgi:hypothetical protein